MEIGHYWVLIQTVRVPQSTCYICMSLKQIDIRLLEILLLAALHIVLQVGLSL